MVHFSEEPEGTVTKSGFSDASDFVGAVASIERHCDAPATPERHRDDKDAASVHTCRFGAT